MANEELQRRSRRVRIFWIAAAVLAVGAIGVSMMPDPIEVDVAQADRGDVRVEVVDEGRTRMHEVYIVSAPVTGRVLRVTVEPGDQVGAGAVVARMSRAAAGFLDTRSAAQARAAVTAAEAQLRSAASDLALEGARRGGDHRGRDRRPSGAERGRLRGRSAQVAALTRVHRIIPNGSQHLFFLVCARRTGSDG